MLYGGDDDAPAGELAEIVCVVGSGARHAVGEDEEWELAVVGVVGGRRRTRRQKRCVYLGGDSDAACDGPEKEGKDWPDQGVVDVRKLGVSSCFQTDRLRDPIVPTMGQLVVPFRGII